MPGIEGSIKTSSTSSTGTSSMESRKKTMFGQIKQRLEEESERNNWQYHWENKYKPALFETMVALCKETNSPVLAILGLLIEFVQIFAYSFVNIDWGDSGSAFGNAIRYTQFEFIIFVAFGMDHGAETGWQTALSATQMNVIWVLLAIVTVLMFVMVALLFYVWYSFAQRSFSGGVLPLRALRFLVSVLCGILYIPTLEIMCSAIQIGARFSPALSVIGVFGLIVTVPFCFFMSLTYFNPNPISKAPLSRLNATLEIFEMTLRTLVVFLDVFVQSVPAARTLALLLFSLWNSGYILVNLPYYREGVNQLRFTLCLNLALGGFLGSVSFLIYGVQDENISGDVIFYAWIACCVVLTIACFPLFRYFYHRKVYTIYNALYQTTNPNADVMFYEEKFIQHNFKFRTPYQVEIAVRFMQTEEADKTVASMNLRMAKAIFNRGFTQFDTDPMMLVLYGTFLGVYCKDYHTWKSYLERASLANPNWYAGLVIAQSKSDQAAEVRKTKSGDDALDVVDLLEITNIIKLATRRQNRIKSYTAEIWRLLLTGKVDAETIQGLVSKIYTNEISTKKLLETMVLRFPRNYHALAAYAAFLDEICKQYDDADDFWNLSEEFRQHEMLKMKAHKVTTGFSQNAIEKSQALGEPSSMANIAEEETSKAGPRSEANISEEVANRSEANVTDSEPQKEGPRSEANISDDGSNKLASRSDANLEENSEGAGATLQRQASTYSVMSHATIGGISRRKRPMTNKQWKRFSEYRLSIGEMSVNGIPRVKRVIYSSFLLFLVFPIIGLVWTLTTNSDIVDNIARIKLSGVRKLMSVEIPLRLTYIRDMVQSNSSADLQDNLKYNLPDNFNTAGFTPVPGRNYSLPNPYAYFIDMFETNFTQFEAIQSELFFSADQSSPYFKSWLTPTVPLKYYLGNNTPIWNNTLSIWDSSSEFWTHGRALIRQPDPKSFFKSGNVELSQQWRFVLDNFPSAYYNAFDLESNNYSNENADNIYLLLNISWIILGCSAGIVFIIGIGFIRTAVDLVFREYDLATATLLAIPRSAIEDNYGTVKDLLNAKKKDKKKKKKGFREGEASDSAAEEPKKQETDDDDDDDDDMDFTEHEHHSSSSHASKKKSYLIYTFQYIFALLTIIGLLSMFSAVMYEVSLSLVQAGIRANLSKDIQTCARKITLDVQMLVKPDFHIFPRMEDFRTQLASDLDVFNIIQLALLFGGAHGLAVGRLPDAARQVMFTHVYVNNTYTVDEMVNIFLKAINTILLSDLPLPEDDPNALIVNFLSPLIGHGFSKLEDANSVQLDLQIAARGAIAEGLFAVVVVGLCLIYAVIFRKLIDNLQDEHEKSQRMLLQVPPESAKVNYPLQILLRGKEAAKDFYKMESIPGVIVDSHGHLNVQYSMTNLEFVKSVAMQSSSDLRKHTSSLFGRVKSLFASKKHSRSANSVKDELMRELKPSKSKDDKKHKGVGFKAENEILASNDYDADEDEQDDEEKSDDKGVDEAGDEYDDDAPLVTKTKFQRLKPNGSITKFQLNVEPPPNANSTSSSRVSSNVSVDHLHKKAGPILKKTLPGGRRLSFGNAPMIENRSIAEGTSGSSVDGKRSVKFSQEIFETPPSPTYK